MPICCGCLWGHTKEKKAAKELEYRMQSPGENLQAELQMWMNFEAQPWTSHNIHQSLN